MQFLSTGRPLPCGGPFFVGADHHEFVGVSLAARLFADGLRLGGCGTARCACRRGADDRRRVSLAAYVVAAANKPAARPSPSAPFERSVHCVDRAEFAGRLSAPCHGLQRSLFCNVNRGTGCPCAGTARRYACGRCRGSVGDRTRGGSGGRAGHGDICRERAQDWRDDGCCIGSGDERGAWSGDAWGGNWDGRDGGGRVRGRLLDVACGDECGGRSGLPVGQASRCAALR